MHSWQNDLCFQIENSLDLGEQFESSSVLLLKYVDLDKKLIR
jgi:hypothetical protein